MPAAVIVGGVECPRACLFRLDSCYCWIHGCPGDSREQEMGAGAPLRTKPSWGAFFMYLPEPPSSAPAKALPLLTSSHSIPLPTLEGMGTGQDLLPSAPLLPLGVSLSPARP